MPARIEMRGIRVKKPTLLICAILSGCALLLSGIWIYFQKNLEQVDMAEGGKGATYDRHYILIADEKDSMLWRAIYDSAFSQATDSDAYLEMLQPGGDMDFSVSDCLEISIASQVDGIILRPDGSDEVRDRIDEAANAGIPVITVLEDDTSSRRLSFVGANSYQMGDAYMEQILSLMGGEDSSVLFLANSQFQNSGTGLIYSQMVKEVERRKAPDQEVDFSYYAVDGSAEFTSEEVIRDIFLSGDRLPDIIICLDEVGTESTYQALLDYNQVEQVDIIGFYYSDQILDGVAKGIIPATVALDTEEIGAYSINALEEYHSLGYTSNYYSVGLEIITDENVSEFMSEDGGADQETEETEETGALQEG